MNESINDEAVYRTAPATPGLLIKRNNKIILKTLSSTFYYLNIKIISMTTFFIWNFISHIINWCLYTINIPHGQLNPCCLTTSVSNLKKNLSAFTPLKCCKGLQCSCSDCRSIGQLPCYGLIQLPLIFVFAEVG